MRQTKSRRWKKPKKVETSKLIITISYVISLVLTIIVVVGTFLNHDMGYVTQIALASYLELSASNVWYFKKATRENVFKNLPKDKTDQIDVNNLL